MIVAAVIVLGLLALVALSKDEIPAAVWLALLVFLLCL